MPQDARLPWDAAARKMLPKTWCQTRLSSAAPTAAAAWQRAPVQCESSSHFGWFETRLTCICASLILVSSRNTSRVRFATDGRTGLSQLSSSACCSCPHMMTAFSKSLAAASTWPSPGVFEERRGGIRWGVGRGRGREGCCGGRGVPATGTRRGGSTGAHGRR